MSTNSNKIEDAILLLASHAPNDVRQQVEAMFPRKPEPAEGEAVEESHKPKAKSGK